MRDLNPRDFRLRVFETRALGRYANPPSALYFAKNNSQERRMSELVNSLEGGGSRQMRDDINACFI